jgi:hypothetical protein
MSRIRLFTAAIALFGLGSPASAQHAIIKPGDVVAGKTISAASDIAVSDTGRLVFRGAFEEGGKQQAGLFDYDLSTKAVSLIASTETPFDGFTLTDVGQPSLSSTGKLVWRGGLEQGAVIFGDSGPLVKPGDMIAPGKVAVDPYEPLINDAGATLFFDGKGGVQLPSTQFAEFPWTGDGVALGSPVPNSSTFFNFGAAAFVDSTHGDIAVFLPTGGAPDVLVNVDATITRAYAVSYNEDAIYSFIADVSSVRSVVRNWTIVADQNDLADDGSKLGAMTELQLTSSLRTFVASEGRIIELPEPSAFFLGLLGVLGAAAQVSWRRGFAGASSELSAGSIPDKTIAA